MNRKQRRDYARQVARGEIGISEKPKTQLVLSELIDHNGKRYNDLNKYLDAMEKDTAEQCAEIASKMLYETEVYIGVANILTFILAIERTIGNLKTVQNSYQKILDNYNDANDYLDARGIRETYNELKRDYGIHLDFEDCDISIMQNASEEVLKRFRLRIGKEAS